MPHVLAAPDKFKGTASAGEAAAAIVRGAQRCGWTGEALPLSDGGDGLLDVFGGPNRYTVVSGPLGAPVRAGWRLDGHDAVVESAVASGLVLAGGAESNDPLAATSRGTGELVEAAVAAGARTVLVGIGGVASSDGGTGALDALGEQTLAAVGDGSVRVVVCCDVRTRYEDAARVFGPQKGADAGQVAELTARLRSARAALLHRFGVDVGAIDGSGAAGGLGGAFAAIGATLRPGFELVAERVGLAERIAAADLVVTGEGRFDATSLDAKVVTRVARLCADAGRDVVAVVGTADDVDAPLDVVSLTQRCGHARAMEDTAACIEEVTAEVLTDRRR